MGSGGGKKRDCTLDEHPDESDGLEEDETVSRRRKRVGGEYGHAGGLTIRCACEVT